MVQLFLQVHIQLIGYRLAGFPHRLQSPLGVNVLVLHLVDEVVPLRCCRACPGRVAASFCHFRQAWCCRTREANVWVGGVEVAIVSGGGFKLIGLKRNPCNLTITFINLDSIESSVLGGNGKAILSDQSPDGAIAIQLHRLGWSTFPRLHLI